MTSDIQQTYGWASKQESESNRLRGVEDYKLTVSPAAADIWFKVVAERDTRGTEVRGQIVGPRSLFAQAAEAVAPLRSVRQQGNLIARTAIQAPAFWAPDSPLLYRVVIELWQDEQRCAVAGFDLGFRRLELSSAGVLVNEKPFVLKGIPGLPQSREEAIARRQAGYNLALARKGEWHWWVRANPMGFLLLEQVTLSTLTPQYISLLCRQPCFFGFVLGKELLERSVEENERFLQPWQERGVLIGLELDEANVPPLPNGLSFIVCPEAILPALASTSLPKLVLRESECKTDEPATALAQGVLGWIERIT